MSVVMFIVYLKLLVVMSVDWKVKGKFLKMGIKTYVLPNNTKEMV